MRRKRERAPRAQKSNGANVTLYIYARPTCVPVSVHARAHARVCVCVATHIMYMLRRPCAMIETKTGRTVLLYKNVLRTYTDTHAIRVVFARAFGAPVRALARSAELSRAMQKVACAHTRGPSVQGKEKGRAAHVCVCVCASRRLDATHRCHVVAHAADNQ